MSHGFTHWADVGRGQRRAVCTCGWSSSAGWKKSEKDFERQMEQLRTHVTSTWREEPVDAEQPSR